MGLFQIVSALLVALSSLLPASCHKTSPRPKNAPAAAITTAPNPTPTIHQLGDVVLTNHFETCVDLGDGQSCILTPRVIDRENFQITLRLESKTSVGQTSNLSVTRINAKNGQLLEITLGNHHLCLTPQIKVDLAQLPQQTGKTAPAVKHR